MNHELILIVSPAEAPVNTAVSYLLNFFVWAFSFGIVFWLVTCLRPMFTMGKILASEGMDHTLYPVGETGRYPQCPGSKEYGGRSMAEIQRFSPPSV